MTHVAPSERIPTLDGWRGVAILAVIASHSQALFYADGALPAPQIAHVLGYFRQGVDLFFAISGFLITRLLLRELEATSDLSLKGFYARRSFRILPLVVVYLGVVLALGVLYTPIASSWEVATTLLFVRNYVMRWGGPATAHFWSLSVEEHFYLLWPPLLLLLRPRRALIFAALFALGISAWRALDVRLGLFARVFPDDPGVLFRTDARLDALVYGAIPALAWEPLKTACARMTRLPLTAMLLAAVTAVNVLSVPLAPTLLAMLFPALIVSTAFRPGSRSAALLALKPLPWIGKISYSLYVWQTLFLQVDEISFSRDAHGFGQLPRYALDIALALICAVTSHHLVELPFQRIGRRWSASMMTSHALAAERAQ